MSKSQCISVDHEISINDVIAYCKCPKYYELKNKYSGQYNLLDEYDKAIHKCFYTYLHTLQLDPSKCSITLLKQKWGKEWVKQSRNSEIICTPMASKRDTYDAKRLAGVHAILTFEEIIANTPQFPIIINKPYRLKIADNIILTGTWEYIREIERNGQKIIQLLKFRTEHNWFSVNHQILHDLELTAAAMAFEDMFNTKGFEIVYVDIYKKKLISSYRTQKDYDLLKETVSGVVKCIQNNIKCISPDKNCYHCEYRKVCDL